MPPVRSTCSPAVKKMICGQLILDVQDLQAKVQRNAVMVSEDRNRALNYLEDLMLRLERLELP